MELLSDLRHAVRMYGRTPLATGIAVLSLALGIGANTSSFIPVEAIILHPLPYPNGSRVVAISEHAETAADQKLSLSPAEYFDLRQQTPALSQVAALENSSVLLSANGSTDRVQGCRVTRGFFNILGMRPLRGRTLDDAARFEPGERIAVVSESFWRARLGAKDPASAFVEVDGQNIPIAGVMPDSFDYPATTQVWMPLDLSTRRQDRTDHTLSAIASLKPGATAREANAQLALLSSRLADQFTKTNQGRQIEATGLEQFLSEPITNRFLLVLLAASGFVLLLACANTGNLQLARAALREREMAVRFALGASRSRIIRQLAGESILLSCGAGLLGLVLASWSIALTKRGIPPIAYKYVPALRHMQVDPSVAVFTVVVSIVVGLLCSVPSIVDNLQRANVAQGSDALRTRGATGAPVRNRMRSLLIVGELALSLILLVGAALMVATFNRMLEANQGFDPHNVLMFDATFRQGGVRSAQDELGAYDRSLSGVGALPGVVSAGIGAGFGTANDLQIEGRAPVEARDPKPDFSAVSPQYLSTLRIPLIQGRGIGAQDGATAPKVAVISETVARRYWPAGDAIGHRIKLTRGGDWFTVAGIAGNIVEDTFTDVAAYNVYVPLAQMPSDSPRFYVRTASDPAIFGPPVRAAMTKSARELVPFDMEPYEKHIADDLAGVRSAAQTMMQYAGIALVLALTGIYAVIAYFVAARTQEIGVRMALGANRSQVLRLVLRRALVLTGTGLGIGVPLSLALAKGMSAALYGTVHLNVWTFGVYVAALMVAALLASYLPSWRAARIDPVAALRNE